MGTKNKVPLSVCLGGADAMLRVIVQAILPSAFAVGTSHSLLRPMVFYAPKRKDRSILSHHLY